MKTAFRIGDWRVDPDRHEIQTVHQTIRVEPRVMHLLVYMAEHAGEVMTREEILESVWEGTFVSDEALTSAIRKLRRAFGDDGREAELIQTIPKKGYLFNAVGSLAEGFVVAGAEPSESHRWWFRKEQHTVGREAVIAQLKRGLSSAEEGRGVVLCPVGEPGIGKTAVVGAFLSEVAAEPKRLWIGGGRCSERLAGTEAYLPLLEAFDSLLGDDERGELAPLMKEVAPSWYFQLKPASTDEGAYTRASSQERMKRELTSFLAKLSQQKPVILLLEDLHWADASTVDLLAHLAERLDSMRALVIATYRIEEMRLAKHPFLGVRSDLVARGTWREIDLPFLTERDVATFLSLEFPDHRFPAELSSFIHVKTEGSPLFMVDLLRYLQDRQVIVKEDLEWHLAQSIPEMDGELPQSVRAMIERKIDRLSESDYRLMLAASVQGFEFHAAVLATVLERDPAEVEERLEALGRVHSLIQFVGEEEFPDRTLTVRYRFVHVLYQNVLHGSLGPTTRVSWSLAVAETLQSHLGEESTTLASELAVLFEAGRDAGRSANYYRTASENASKVFAYREAAELARRGLRILERVRDSPERVQQELRLQMALGPALIATKGYASPEVGDAFARARELCRQMGQTPQLFLVLHGLYRFYLTRSDLTEAVEYSKELVHLAEREQDPNLLIPAHRAAGTGLLHLGEFGPAREHFEQGFALYRPEYHDSFVFLYGQDEGLVCAGMLSWTQWYLGYLDQALKPDEDALRLARQSPNPYVLAYALILSSFFHSLRREPQVARERSEEAIALSEEHGYALFVAWATMWRGCALSALGFSEEGVSNLKRGVDGWRGSGARIGVHLCLALLAEACGKAGQIEEGLAVLREAFAAIPGTGRQFEAELHRIRGELLSLKGNVDDLAEASFRRALEIARRQKAKSLELRAATSLSRLWRKQGKEEQGRQTLAEIYDWFTEGLETRDLLDTKALLGELSPKRM